MIDAGKADGTRAGAFFVDRIIERVVEGDRHRIGTSRRIDQLPDLDARIVAATTLSLCSHQGHGLAVVGDTGNGLHGAVVAIRLHGHTHEQQSIAARRCVRERHRIRTGARNRLCRGGIESDTGTAGCIRGSDGPGIIVAGIAVAVAFSGVLRDIGGTGVIHGREEVDAGQVLRGRRVGIEQDRDPAARCNLGREIDAKRISDGIVGKADRNVVDLDVGHRRYAEAAGHRNCNPIDTRVAATDGGLDVIFERIAGGTRRHVVRADFSDCGRYRIIGTSRRCRACGRADFRHAQYTVVETHVIHETGQALRTVLAVAEDEIDGGIGLFGRGSVIGHLVSGFDAILVYMDVGAGCRAVPGDRNVLPDVIRNAVVGRDPLHVGDVVFLAEFIGMDFRRRVVALQEPSTVARAPRDDLADARCIAGVWIDPRHDGERFQVVERRSRACIDDVVVAVEAQRVAAVDTDPGGVGRIRGAGRSECCCVAIAGVVGGRLAAAFVELPVCDNA